MHPNFLLLLIWIKKRPFFVCRAALLLWCIKAEFRVSPSRKCVRGELINTLEFSLGQQYCSVALRNHVALEENLSEMMHPLLCQQWWTLVFALDLRWIKRVLLKIFSLKSGQSWRHNQWHHYYHQYFTLLSTKFKNVENIWDGCMVTPTQQFDFEYNLVSNTIRFRIQFSFKYNSISISKVRSCLW